jgi:hypothetical protein
MFAGGGVQATQDYLAQDVEIEQRKQYKESTHDTMMTSLVKG